MPRYQKTLSNLYKFHGFHNREWLGKGRCWYRKTNKQQYPVVVRCTETDDGIPTNDYHKVDIHLDMDFDFMWVATCPANMAPHIVMGLLGRGEL